MMQFHGSEKILAKLKKKKKKKRELTQYKHIPTSHSMLMSYIIPVLSAALPPERAPSGREPVGVRPLSWSTLSLSSL